MNGLPISRKPDGVSQDKRLRQPRNNSDNVLAALVEALPRDIDDTQLRSDERYGMQDLPIS